MMEHWELIAWILIMLLGFGGSAMYSGLETGYYTLNRIRLQVREHQHDPAAIAIKQMVEQPTPILATLLIGNNVTNQLGTVGLGSLLLMTTLQEWEVILLNILIVTPILFIFGETLPKDLFAVHSDRLMYRLQPVLSISKRICTWLGLIWLINNFSTLVIYLLGGESKTVPTNARYQISALMREGAGYGLISDEQSAMVERVLSLSRRRVRDVMVPWGQVSHLKQHERFISQKKQIEHNSHTRYPVVDEAGKVTGLANMFDLLADTGPAASWQNIVEPIEQLEADMLISEALERLQRSQRHMAVIYGANNMPVGIVTTKNLIEPITGELASW